MTISDTEIRKNTLREMEKIEHEISEGKKYYKKGLYAKGILHWKKAQRKLNNLS